MSGKLYLIPSFLGKSDKDLIPEYNLRIVHGLTHFVAEREKTARAFLKAIDHPISQSEFNFEILDKRTSSEHMPSFLDPCLQGSNLGLLSEAGLPCVADPGAKLVNAARKKGIEIVPLSGLSSIMMALMASGMNGQQFRFRGYLPIDQNAKNQTIKEISNAATRDETQLFIETPYRNDKMLQDLIKILSPSLRIGLGIDLSMDSEEIHCKSVAEWKSGEVPKMHKRPCVFMVGV
jgi:16S rRNA (cytidine1402-2'-O)-methyltransferase